MLWVEKYRPRTLDELSYHSGVTRVLKKLCESPSELPHLLLYGSSGAGKKTRVSALLRGLFGASVERVKSERRSFKVRSKCVEISVISSKHHIEMSPADCGIYDRIVIQELVKEIASAASVANVKQKKKKDGVCFKVLLLCGCSELSRDAQNSLRRTMEKYMANCRLILIADSACKIIDPLRSRCLSIRVGLPNESQMSSVLNQVAKQERLSIDESMMKWMIQHSQRNLRRALLMLECYNHNSNPNNNQSLIAPWMLFCQDLSRLICEEQSPQRLLLVRAKMYELLANCIPAGMILDHLSQCLMAKMDDDFRPIISHSVAFHQHRLILGSKPIMHLEAFVAQFMALYKRFMLDIFDQ